MRRVLATTAVSMALWSCAPLLDPNMAAQTPVQDAAIPDAQAAMAAARKACRVSTLDLWLSPYRWHVALRDGMWHVRVPAFRGALECSYYDVDIRAADGSTSHCKTCPPDTVVVASVN